MSHTSESSFPSARPLVIGGAGFLGSHIVKSLKENSNVIVLVLDRVAPSIDDKIEDVEYALGDITDETSLIETFGKFQPDVVHHTASPIHGLPSAIYYRVNEEGTRIVLSACKSAGVKVVVYTSSTGVVWTGVDFVPALHSNTENINTSSTLAVELSAVIDSLTPLSVISKRVLIEISLDNRNLPLQ
ncbi:hypothetical protein CPB84DRAFT_1754229 [Gymnopilus junonius]|uniref:3-beta hydroxysteroid dehydrogenase/isomerase domain-containing protein n=1 Tax=Gymnopilus junonius TaxID=109634 RepID=A0A9P5N9X9_GYMJU|nr:hypothetical protein CPB84DRAFT_1754229 [Gymnopilus junonius]